MLGAKALIPIRQGLLGFQINPLVYAGLNKGPVDVKSHLGIESCGIPQSLGILEK